MPEKNNAKPDYEMLASKTIDLMQVLSENGGKFTNSAVQIINEVATEAEKSQMYVRGAKAREAFMKEVATLTQEGRAATLYLHMCERIITAPTSTHRAAAVIMLMPMIRDALKEGESEK